MREVNFGSFLSLYTFNDDTFPSVHSSTDKDNFLYEDKNSSNLVFRSYLNNVTTVEQILTLLSLIFIKRLGWVIILFFFLSM